MVQNTFSGGGPGSKTVEPITITGLTNGATLTHSLGGDVAIQYIDTNNEFVGGFVANNVNSTSFTVTLPFGVTTATGTIIAFKK